MALSRSKRERVGKLEAFPVNAVPAGWYECVGGTKLIAGDPALYAYLGTRYGGDGVTTFGLPDYQDMVHKGLNRGGARTVGDYEAPNVGAHAHGIRTNSEGGSGGITGNVRDSFNAPGAVGSQGTEVAGAGNTTVANKSVVYGIKR